MSRFRNTARLAALPAALGLGLLAAAPAMAHVTISPSTGEAGAYTVLTVSVPHGCDGSATTKVAVQIPEEIVAVTPTRNPLWKASKVMTKLAAPVKDEDGNEITERVGQVVYTAKTPLPDGYRDAFELSLQLPEDAAGKTLRFPAIQTCEKGQTAWVEVPASGQSEDDLEHPAPAVEVTAASDDPDTPDEPAEPAEESESESGSDGSGTTLGWIGIVLGALGLGAGGTALARGRR